MKLLTSLFLLTIAMFTLNLHAQTIEMKKGFGGYQFFQDGKKLKVSKMVSLMESNSEALALMKSAQSNYTTGQIIGFAGGFLVGWSIGQSLNSESDGMNWGLLGLGAGLTAISIPFSANFNKKAKQAVDIYNAEFDSSLLHQSPTLQFKLEANVNRVGIVMSF